MEVIGCQRATINTISMKRGRGGGHLFSALQLTGLGCVNRYQAFDVAVERVPYVFIHLPSVLISLYIKTSKLLQTSRDLYKMSY